MNLKRWNAVVLSTCECSTDYIPVHNIAPWSKWGDDDDNLPIIYIIWFECLFTN